MVSRKLTLVLLPLAVANTYVTPFADGSDGWQDAFDKAKGGPLSKVSGMTIDLLSFGIADDVGREAKHHPTKCIRCTGRSGS